MAVHLELGAQIWTSDGSPSRIRAGTPIAVCLEQLRSSELDHCLMVVLILDCLKLHKDHGHGLVSTKLKWEIYRCFLTTCILFLQGQTSGKLQLDMVYSSVCLRVMVCTHTRAHTHDTYTLTSATVREYTYICTNAHTHACMHSRMHARTRSLSLSHTHTFQWSFDCADEHLSPL